MAYKKLKLLLLYSTGIAFAAAPLSTVLFCKINQNLSSKNDSVLPNNGNNEILSNQKIIARSKNSDLNIVTQTAVSEDGYFTLQGSTIVGLTESGKKQKVLKIPDSITEIGGKAFVNSSIESIDFTNATNLRKIGPSAFEFALQNIGDNLIDLSKTQITEIGSRAFSYCQIKNIVFPST